jgi:hypothetical protein
MPRLLGTTIRAAANAARGDTSLVEAATIAGYVASCYFHSQDDRAYVVGAAGLTVAGCRRVVLDKMQGGARVPGSGMLYRTAVRRAHAAVSDRMRLVLDAP